MGLKHYVNSPLQANEYVGVCRLLSAVSQQCIFSNYVYLP